MAAWALADCHPPGGERRSFLAKSQGLWLPGELLEALLGELRPLVQSWIETGGLERWEAQEKAMPLHLLLYLWQSPDTLHRAPREQRRQEELHRGDVSSATLMTAVLG